MLDISKNFNLISDRMSDSTPRSDVRGLQYQAHPYRSSRILDRVPIYESKFGILLLIVKTRPKRDGDLPKVVWLEMWERKDVQLMVF
jgi:hypothetical protein